MACVLGQANEHYLKGRPDSEDTPIAMLLSIPDATLGKIATSLSIYEVMKLQSTCRYFYRNAAANFWQPKFDVLPEDIPRPASDSPLEVWVAQYIEWYQKALGISSSCFFGSWLDDGRYWERDVPESSSPYGTVRLLKHVCWLDFGGRLLCPPGGTFIVALRCKVGKCDACEILHQTPTSL